MSKEVRDEIIAQLPTDDLVRTRLLEPTYSRNLVRYLYYRINEQLTHNQDTIRFDSKTLQEHSAHPNPRKDVSTPQHARQPADCEKMEHPQGAKS